MDTGLQDEMPFNIVEGDDSNPGPDNSPADEAEWRTQNLPSDDLNFRWRYADAKIQLYERRLRSLASFGVGPAVQAWVRSRLEWMQDNRFREQPDGVLEVTITAQGDVGMGLREPGAPFEFDLDRLVWEKDTLAGCALADEACPSVVWVVADGTAYASSAPLRHAADTFVRDLLETFGIAVAAQPPSRELVARQDAELFCASDEFGILPFDGRSGCMCSRLSACFDKLWAC